MESTNSLSELYDHLEELTIRKTLLLLVLFVHCQHWLTEMRTEEKTLILFILARSFETSVNFANNNNIVKISKNIYVTAYLIIWGILIFCVYFDKSLTQPSVANTLPKLGFYKTNDFIFLHNICPQIESSRIHVDPLNFGMKLYKKLTSSK